jgi:hypothetical protein
LTRQRQVATLLVTMGNNRDKDLESFGAPGV